MIQNNYIYFCDCMHSNEATNETKFDKLYYFNVFVLIIQRYLCHKSQKHTNYNVNE
jgi:hypothetical protein